MPYGRVFGSSAGQVVISNTKGFTGHAMGAGVEDVVAIKAIETGIVPPVPNYKVPDPDLGELNLSQGGTYPVRYALRLGAGFGSQVSMTLYRLVPPPGGHHPEPDQLGFEYRIVNPEAWQSWLVASCGLPSAVTEIARRTLRIRDDGPPAVGAPAEPAAKSLAGSVDDASRPRTPARPHRPPRPRPRRCRLPRPPPPAAGRRRGAPPATRSRRGCWRSWPSRPATPPTCSTWTSTWKPTSASTPSNKPRPSPPSEPPTTSNATTASPCATTRPCATSSPSSTNAPRTHRSRPRAATARRPPADAAVPAPAGDEVEARVLEIVAEQTGYPSDLLDLDLDLEADLGIDTVKQAETFAAIRAAYDIERDDRLALRDYPTLRHVIAFVYERAPDTHRRRPRAPTPPRRHPGRRSRPGARRRRGGGAGAGDRGRADRLPLRPARLGPRPGSRPRHRHRQTSRDLRRHPSRLRHRTRRPPRPARLPDPAPRHRLRLRTRPDTHRRRTCAPTAVPLSDTPAAGLVEGDDAEAAAIPRRIPTAVLRPPLELCQPTGIQLGEGSRVVVMLDDGGSGSALIGRLEERGVAVLAVEGAPAADELAARLDTFVSGGPISGVYWLPALDAEPPIGELDLAGWRELLRRRVKLLYTTMHHLGEAIGGSGTFLLSATRLGGRHGYDSGGAEAPMGGAVTGFTKAFKRENPDALVKAVDVAQDASPEAVADLLVEETLRDPGAVEVGHGAGERWTVALREVPLGTTPAGIELGPDTVFAITGAAGSIVAAITADLARASHGTFHLLDLVPRARRGRRRHRRLRAPTRTA